MNTIRALVLLLGSGLLAQSVHAQDLPALKVRTVRALSIGDDLPTGCFEQAITDQQGRLWLVTCGEAQHNRNIHLIQFDGRSGDVHNLGLARGSSIILGGFVSDSVLAGIDVLAARLLHYSVPSGEALYYQPEDTGYLFYSIQLVGNRTFILAYRGSTHVILEFVNARFVVRSELEGVKQFEAILYVLGLRRRVVTIGDQIWFTDEEHSVYRFDTGTGEVSIFKTPSGEHLRGSSLLNWGGQLVVGFGSPDEYGILDFQNNALHPLQILPPGAHYCRQYQQARFLHFVYADRAGWLFINYQDASGSIHRDIVRRDGMRYDYSQVIASLPSNDYGILTGDDFTSSISAYSGMLVFAEISKDYGMKAFPTFPGRAMLQTDQNTILCLTDVQPVKLNLETDSMEALPVSERIKPSERKNIILDDEQTIWYVDHDSLLRFSPESKAFQSWIILGGTDYFIQYKDRILFINQGLLFELTPSTGKIRQIAMQGEYERIGGTANMMQLSDDQLWIATSVGLWHVDLQSGGLHRVSIAGRQDIQLLTCLLDSKGMLWLGTESAGVVRYDRTTEQARFCDRTQGLSHNTVVGILEDNSGNLWVSTFDGLSVVSADMEVIAKFFARDGLVYDEGNRWSHLKLEDGRMLFGSEQGFTLIDPVKALSKFRENPAPRIYCKSVIYTPTHLDHQITVLNPDINQERFYLPFDQRNIELHVGTSDYITSAQTEYQYLINRPGYQWVSVGNEPGIAITNLPTGTSDILVRALSAKGVWSQNAIRISIDVAQPFYLKWWFFVLCALPFLGYLILWAWRVRVERRHLEGEVRKRTAQIAAQTEELRQLDQAKTRIYTNITHEFRTPLTVIRGTSELIEGTDEKGQIIRRNSDRLLNLVNQMLELSKLESGNLVARMSFLNVVHLIRDIFESFSAVAGDKDVGMHFYAHPQEIVMDCDVEIMHRIVGNLLSNALKFTPSGGNIYVEVSQLDKDEREHVRISVRDTGIGISEDKINKIFDRFYQVDDSITRPGEGTGIGLALTRELVDFLEGSIDVHSTSGSGSTFIITLPVTKNAADRESGTPIQYDQSIAASLSSGRNTIAESQQFTNELPTALIVEDNPDVIHYLVNCLQGQYQLHIAMDGQEGVEKAVQFVPDLIISDVMMPLKDGIQLCQEVKHDERTSHIPVILLTARTDVASRLEGLARGADAYMAKPFQKEELLLTARNLIESRKALCSRYLADAIPGQSEHPDIQQEDDFILRLNTLIEEHLDDEDYGVMPLSHAMKYSRSQIHNKVKALTGMSTSAYIQHKRLIHARQMLASGEKNVSEVAYAVGFRDPSYFSRVFRKEFGASPTDFLQEEGKT